MLVRRKPSTSALEEASTANANVAVVTQRDPDIDEISVDNLYPLATEASVMRLLKMPDGTTQAWMQGKRRIRIQEVFEDEPLVMALCEVVRDEDVEGEDTEALIRTVLTLFEKVVRLSPSLPNDAYVMAMNIPKAGPLADFIAAALSVSEADAEDVLATAATHERLQRVSALLARELDVLELQGKIHDQVQSEVDRSQREFYLREQIRAIQRELGEQDPIQRDIIELREKIGTSGMPESVAEKTEHELRRMEQMPAASPEISIVRTYIDWLVTLPWKIQTEDNIDIAHAAETLDRNHYGLSKVKERILEYMAVRKLTEGESRGSPILCFVGPPGVGKTSLGRSIAEALGRKFVRISLGGVRDEAEIRGHRRTYVGAMPGRIIQTMRQAGTVNPVFMLDEVDKVGADFRGDPSAALLEVLDPEQNHAFSDHYLDVDFDLSKVMFIATANMMEPVIPALRDRLEVIELPGYIEDEKLHIAQKFLVSKQLAENGLGDDRLRFGRPALLRLIREYTHEAGVRNLEREIGSVCRKVARRVAEGIARPVTVQAADVPRYLGPQKFFWGLAEESDEVGVATGVARTDQGGDVLAVEVALVPGKGSLLLTGQLGDVMRESAQAALSYTRARSAELGLPEGVFESSDIHVHVPAGAVPKEGPSAGITIATALISALTKQPVRRDVAMTGEITLRGHVLPIGGVREKVMAAHRAGISTFVLPKKNEKDLEEVPAEVRRALTFIAAEDMDQVLGAALLRQTAELKAV
jgi:ATP-dependent Lon protease